MAGVSPSFLEIELSTKRASDARDLGAVRVPIGQHRHGSVWAAIHWDCATRAAAMHIRLMAGQVGIRLDALVQHLTGGTPWRVADLQQYVEQAR